MNKPKKIFIIRHGQSEANVDKSVYVTKPDFAVNLTPLGTQQAVSAGIELKSIVPENEKFSVYYSPFFRGIQTLNHISVSLGKDRFDREFIREDPRIREQEWYGNFAEEGYNDEKSDILEEECNSYGKFFYRFAGGESSADVYDRVSDFINTIHRDFEKENYPENTIIVTHGMTMRVILMKWFHKTVQEFETWVNPKNCQILTLTLNEETKKYDFDFEIIKKTNPLHPHVCKLEI
jgi:broad specificity phosphatase PhoE